MNKLTATKEEEHICDGNKTNTDVFCKLSHLVQLLESANETYDASYMECDSEFYLSKVEKDDKFIRNTSIKYKRIIESRI